MSYNGNYIAGMENKGGICTDHFFLYGIRAASAGHYPPIRIIGRFF